jgi:hypothetical protein
MTTANYEHNARYARQYNPAADRTITGSNRNSAVIQLETQRQTSTFLSDIFMYPAKSRIEAYCFLPHPFQFIIHCQEDILSHRRLHNLFRPSSHKPGMFIITQSNDPLYIDTFSSLPSSSVQIRSLLFGLTLNLPTTTIVAQPFNVIKWQLKFNPVA